MVDLAVIGGTSLQNFKALKPVEVKRISTSYGACSNDIQIGEIHGKQIAFLNRHGEGSKIPPHKINYRANIDALDQLGVKQIIAINAVGGISPYAGPLHVSVPAQIIDYTHGREHTYFEGGEMGVSFVDFSQPFSEELRRKLIWSAQELRLHDSSAGFSEDSCYACTQGPRLETAAEIKKLARDGCDLVGMTMMPEAVLAREKKLEYASVCLVVNWAAGLMDSPITMMEIRQLVDSGSSLVEQLLSGFIKQF